MSRAETLGRTVAVKAIRRTLELHEKGQLDEAEALRGILHLSMRGLKDRREPVVGVSVRARWLSNKELLAHLRRDEKLHESLVR